MVGVVASLKPCDSGWVTDETGAGCGRGTSFGCELAAATDGLWALPLLFEGSDPPGCPRVSAIASVSASWRQRLLEQLSM